MRLSAIHTAGCRIAQTAALVPRRFLIPLDEITRPGFLERYRRPVGDASMRCMRLACASALDLQFALHDAFGRGIEPAELAFIATRSRTVALLESRIRADGSVRFKDDFTGWELRMRSVKDDGAVGDLKDYTLLSQRSARLRAEMA